MPKTGKAPKGYYSASQVMTKLGIASSTLHHFVSIGKIKRIVPPNMRDGFYVQAEVDEMANERELFLLTYMNDTPDTLIKEDSETDWVQVALRNLSQAAKTGQLSNEGCAAIIALIRHEQRLQALEGKEKSIE